MNNKIATLKKLCGEQLQEGSRLVRLPRSVTVVKDIGRFGMFGFYEANLCAKGISCPSSFLRSFACEGMITVRWEYLVVGDHKIPIAERPWVEIDSKPWRQWTHSRISSARMRLVGMEDEASPLILLQVEMLAQSNPLAAVLITDVRTKLGERTLVAGERPEQLRLPVHL